MIESKTICLGHTEVQFYYQYRGYFIPDIVLEFNNFKNNNMSVRQCSQKKQLQVALLTLETFDHAQLQGLLHREETYLQKRGFFEFHSSEIKWRPKISEWMYKIVDHFSLDREIVAFAMDLLDRFNLFYSTKDIDSELYQRAAMTCLFISVKMNCGYCCSHSRSLDHTHQCHQQGLFRVNDYAALSRGQFTAQDIIEMEMLIFQTLDWKLNPVIPLNYLPHLLSLFPRDTTRRTTNRCNKESHDLRFNMQYLLNVLHEVVRYLIELFTISLETTRCGVKPSMICYSAILMSMDMIDELYLPQDLRSDFITRSKAELRFQKEEVQRMKRIMVESFIPESILAGTLSQEKVMMELQKLHPFIIFKNAGVLCEQSTLFAFMDSLKIQIEHKKRRRMNPSSPTSVME